MYKRRARRQGERASLGASDESGIDGYSAIGSVQQRAWCRGQGVVNMEQATR